MSKRYRELCALVVFLGICLGISAIGGAITATSVGNWYQTLRKPSFNPPDWVFAPVWTALFVMMAVAGWLVWRKRDSQVIRPALAVFALQLALNLGWSALFFGKRMIGVALIEVIALFGAIVVTAVMFWRIDRLGGALLVPYAAWVAFAVLLNQALWQLN